MKNVHWFDEECKRLLSNKKILLNILKREIKEYKGLSDAEILKLISEPQLGTVNDGDYFETRNVEDYSIAGEPIIFDVMLYAGLPDSDETVGLIINFEVQGDIPPYSVLRRGFYYLGRLIARQKGHPFGFQKSNYDQLKKVIGIWICRTDKKQKGMLNVYHVQEELRGAEVHYPKEEYDVMELIMISPNDQQSDNTSTVDFLSLLFGENIDVENSVKRLEKEYGVVFTQQEREDFEEMCNWSMSYYLNGKDEGRIEGKLEGKLEGKKEGINEEKQLTILEMLKDGVVEPLIMKYARCTLQQIEEARKCLN